MYASPKNYIFSLGAPICTLVSNSLAPPLLRSQIMNTNGDACQTKKKKEKHESCQGPPENFPGNSQNSWRQRHKILMFTPYFFFEQERVQCTL
jgi:hypothetical protein